MRIWFWSPGPMQNQLWPHTSVASALGAWKWEDPGGSQVNQSKQLTVSGPSKGHWLKHKVEKNRSWYLTSTSELHTYTHGVTRMCTHIHAYTIHTKKWENKETRDFYEEIKWLPLLQQIAGRDSFHGEWLVVAHGFSPQSAHSLEPAAKQKHWSGRAWWRKHACSRWPGNRLID